MCSSHRLMKPSEIISNWTNVLKYTLKVEMVLVYFVRILLPSYFIFSLLKISKNIVDSFTIL